MSQLLPIALRFLAQGISVVPVANDGSKRPAFAWQRFQQELPIADELLMWFKEMVYFLLITFSNFVIILFPKLSS